MFLSIYLAKELRIAIKIVERKKAYILKNMNDTASLGQDISCSNSV
jgi:hypothetical protein